MSKPSTPTRVLAPNAFFSTVLYQKSHAVPSPIQSVRVFHLSLGRVSKAPPIAAARGTCAESEKMESRQVKVNVLRAAVSISVKQAEGASSAPFSKKTLVLTYRMMMSSLCSNYLEIFHIRFDTPPSWEGRDQPHCQL